MSMTDEAVRRNIEECNHDFVECDAMLLACDPPKKMLRCSKCGVTKADSFDSRQRLRDDAVESICGIVMCKDGFKLSDVVDKVNAMIDRAFAIRDSELQAKVDELTAERDAWRKRFEKANREKCDLQSNGVAQRFNNLCNRLRDKGVTIRWDDSRSDYWVYFPHSIETMAAERDRWKANYEQRNAEANEFAEKLETLEKRKCPGYDPETHTCNYHAQDFELNDKTVSRLKRENARLSSDELHWHSEADRLAGELERERKLNGELLGACGECPQLVELAAKVKQLEGDLRGARTSRDCWMDRAKKAEKSVGVKKAQLKKEREINGIWPIFDDGERVKVGDEIAHYQSGERSRVHFIEFGQYKTKMYGHDQFPIAICNAAGQLIVKRPQLIAKDGQPIIVGETLIGEDGKAWEIARTDGEFAWTADDEKRLRPEWLTHEEPDSFERIIEDAIRGDGGSYGCLSERIEAIAPSLVERCEKLLKEQS